MLTVNFEFSSDNSKLIDLYIEFDEKENSAQRAIRSLTEFAGSINTAMRLAAQKKQNDRVLSGLDPFDEPLKHVVWNDILPFLESDKNVRK